MIIKNTTFCIVTPCSSKFADVSEERIIYTFRVCALLAALLLLVFGCHTLQPTGWGDTLLRNVGEFLQMYAAFMEI